jgi:hypothetical protein
MKVLPPLSDAVERSRHACFTIRSSAFAHPAPEISVQTASDASPLTTGSDVKKPHLECDNTSQAPQRQTLQLTQRRRVFLLLFFEVWVRPTGTY